MTNHRLAQAAWWLFLAYYFAAKYFVGGFTGFSVPYLVSVAILVLLTAAIPYYGTRWLAGRIGGGIGIGLRLLMPTALSAIGLTLYFFAYIQPNYPAIQLPAILHRVLEPGLLISLILLLPLALERVRPTAMAGDQSEI